MSKKKVIIWIIVIAILITVYFVLPSILGFEIAQKGGGWGYYPWTKVEEIICKIYFGKIISYREGEKYVEDSNDITFECDSKILQFVYYGK